MSITKKQLLTNLYKEFTTEINKFIDASKIFPDLIDMDLIDIIFLINHYFGFTTEYKPIVIELLKINNIEIDDNKFKLLYPIIEIFLNKFKSI